MKKLFWIFGIAILCIQQSVSAQVMGKWKTVDENTGKAKSIVEIYEQNGKIYGKIVKILTPGRQNAVCDKCEGADKGKPILGLVIIKDLVKDDNEYEDGTIFDPLSGKTYTSKIWVDDDNNDFLNVRGYILFFFRTQQWIRVKS